MPKLSRTILDVLRIALHTLERPIGRAVRAVRTRLGLLRPLRLLPYRSYGDAEHLHVIGRVLEDRDLGSAKADDPWWRNAAAMWRRFRTAAIPGVVVRGEGPTGAAECTSDRDGYFCFVLPRAGGRPPTGATASAAATATATATPNATASATASATPSATPSAGACEGLAGGSLWQKVDLEVVGGEPWVRRRRKAPVRAIAEVLVPSADSTFGVVSDLDDTVIESHATDLWKTMRIVFMNNARTRVPLAGAAALYRALHRGYDGARRNPFFYVSSSAWNVYDLFEEFLELHGFPDGPILLRELGLHRSQRMVTGHEHKGEKIEQILCGTGDLPFVLIGDAGQDDAEIYHRIACRAPRRVLAVYIRAVRWRDRTAAVAALAADLHRHGVDMLLVADTRAAAEHAVARGWIPPRALAEIGHERAVDRAVGA